MESVSREEYVERNSQVSRVDVARKIGNRLSEYVKRVSRVLYQGYFNPSSLDGENNSSDAQLFEKSHYALSLTTFAVSSVFSSVFSEDPRIAPLVGSSVGIIGVGMVLPLVGPFLGHHGRKAYNLIQSSKEQVRQEKAGELEQIFAQAERLEDMKLKAFDEELERPQ